MKAVNLIPGRTRSSALSISFGGLRAPTLALIGFLAVALVIVVVLVALGNSINDRKHTLATIQTQVTADNQRAAALAPYVQIANLSQTVAASVRSLQAAQMDWPAVLDQLSRHVPSDVTLTSITAGTGAGSGAGATTGATSGPTLQLNGCTRSHTAVARMMEAMTAVIGVRSVTLGTSTKGSSASAGSGAGACPHIDQFNLTIGLAAFAPTGTGQ